MEVEFKMYNVFGLSTYLNSHAKIEAENQKLLVSLMSSKNEPKAETCETEKSTNYLKVARLS